MKKQEPKRFRLFVNVGGAEFPSAATLIAEAPAGKTTLVLEKKDFGFASPGPLPEGYPYRLVVQLRTAAGQKPQNFRLDLNLATCGGCQLAEYACTCANH